MTGFISLNKPSGVSSFGAISPLRKIFNQKKVGHTGTLDPMASGVLPVALGGASKFIELLPCSDKAYIAKFRLGLTSDTLDITGKILSQNSVNATRADIESALQLFKGEIKQVPPMYSAISKNGVRLYELARQGIEIEREARQVTVYELDLLEELPNDEYSLSISCSSGTYVRSIIDDLGRSLGCGALMTELCRTRANGFTLENSHSLDEVRQAVENGCANEVLTSVEAVFDGLPSVTVSEAQARRFANGGSLDLDRVRGVVEGRLRVYGSRGEFLGIGETTQAQLTVKRIYLP